MAATEFDLVIEGGTVIDGTKAPRFDAERVIDTTTYEDPQRAAAGIDTVIVNGEPLWAAGRETCARPGRVLRRRLEPA